MPARSRERAHARSQAAHSDTLLAAQFGLGVLRGTHQGGGKLWDHRLQRADVRGDRESDGWWVWTNIHAEGRVQEASTVAQERTLRWRC